MEEEKYQKELFEFDQPKRSFSRLADMLPKADFEGKVTFTISLENMVFISIGIVMAMVIVYALGVESGKSRAKAPEVQTVKQAERPLMSTVSQNRPMTIPARNILNTAPIVTTVKPAVPVEQISRNQVKAAAVSQEPKPFTIIVGTFASKQNAQAVAVILTRQGFNATITYNKPYYQACVGSYADKNSADGKKDLIRVKRIYKDAMFRLK